MSGLRWMIAAGLALAAMVVAPSAHAQLYGLTHDRANGTAQLAQIDAASGALTPVGGGLIGCCEIGAAATANDPFGQDLYAVGPDPLSASRELRLLRFALPSGTGTAVGPLGTADRVVGLGFERNTQRLIALLAPASGPLRLVSVNTSTGVATTIHSGSVDCCVLEPGLAALAPGNFLLVGRLRTDAAGTRKLFAYSTSGSNSVTVTALAAGSALAALVSDPQTGMVYGLQQSFSAPPRVPSLQLVQVQPGTGTTPIGAAVNACCAVSLDTAAIQSGALRVVARDPAAASGASLLSFNLSTGVSSFSSGVLPTARIVDGLFELLKGLTASTTTITSIVPSPVAVGQTYTVNVSVSSAASPLTGSVLVTNGLGGSCSIVLPASSCVLAATQIGALTISADYSGGGSIAGSFDSEALAVNQAASSTAISGVVPSPSVVGQAYTVSVLVSGYLPTGTVGVSDGLGGNCNIVLPATSCVLNSISAGPRTLTASYPGDINNLASSATGAHNVIAAASTTSIVSIVPSPSVVGQAYSVTVSVTGFGLPTGTVSIVDGSGGSCSITLPLVSCLLTSTTAGAKTVTANYSGDNNNQPSSGSQAHTVNRAPSTTLITTVVPSPGIAGQAYSVSVAVSGFGTPGGSVSISDGTGGSCTITLPAPSCALVSTTAGNKVLTANYGGDLNNLPSSDTEAQWVNPAPTTTTLTAAPNPAAIDSTVTLTATVAAGVAPRSGTVAFSANGNPIAGCGAVALVADIAVCTTTFNAPGSYALIASYSGNANNLPSTGTVTLLVQAVSIPALTELGLLLLALGIAGLAAPALRRN